MSNFEAEEVKEKALADENDQHDNGRAFEDFVIEELQGVSKHERKARVDALIPLVFVKIKVYAITGIDAVKRTGTCTVDIVVMLDWYDPSLAKAMEQYEKMPVDYDIQANGHFIPSYIVHNAVDEHDTFEPPRFAKGGWKKGHAKMTTR